MYLNVIIYFMLSEIYLLYFAYLFYYIFPGFNSEVIIFLIK